MHSYEILLFYLKMGACTSKKAKSEKLKGDNTNPEVIKNQAPEPAQRRHFEA